MSYVVRLDGAILGKPSELTRFEFREVAVLHAHHESIVTWPNRLITVHDGDATTETSVVAVFRDGYQVGPLEALS